MEKKISIPNLVEDLSGNSNISKSTAESFIRSFFNVIDKGLHDDNQVKIKGLGTFKVAVMADRESVDVNNGERIVIKGYSKVIFTPDAVLKDIVNEPFAKFETTELVDSCHFDDIKEEDKLKDEQDKSVISNERTNSEEYNEAIEQSEPTILTILEIGTQPQEADEERPIEQSKLTITAAETSPKSMAKGHEKSPIPEEKRGTFPNEIFESRTRSSNHEKKKNQKARVSKVHFWRYLLAHFGFFLCLGLIYVFASGKFERIVPWAKYKDVIEKKSPDIINDNPYTTKEKLTSASLPEINTTEISINAQRNGLIDVEYISDDINKSDDSKKINPNNTGKPYVVLLTSEDKTKKITDITPADTTSYLIDGTLTTHEVQAGETIIKLSSVYYGDKRLWPYIVKYNWLKNPDNVPIGTILNIPFLINKDK